MITASLLKFKLYLYRSFVTYRTRFFQVFSYIFTYLAIQGLSQKTKSLLRTWKNKQNLSCKDRAVKLLETGGMPLFSTSETRMGKRDNTVYCFKTQLKLSVCPIILKNYAVMTDLRRGSILCRRTEVRSGSQRHRHFVGFFNVPVLAPTRDQPFYTVIPTHRPICLAAFPVLLHVYIVLFTIVTGSNCLPILMEFSSFYLPSFIERKRKRSDSVI